MSRTDAHTPYHVRARRAKDSRIVHYGCDQDPTGQQRFIRWDYIEVNEDPAWRPEAVEIDRIFAGPARYVYDHESHTYKYLGDSKYEPVFSRDLIMPARGARRVYGPLKYTRRVAVYATVPCDVDNGSNSFRSCRYDSDDALVDTYGFHHKCDWSGLKRELWYKPERQQGREFCRAAAAEYNAWGAAPEDEPYTPSSPRGLWGGGWVD